MAWGLLATTVGIALPFYESRESIGAIFKGIFTGSGTNPAEASLDQQAFPTPSFGKLPDDKIPEAVEEAK